MSEVPKILVTSAAGRIGRDTVRLLLNAGHDVRAMVHRKDSRSRELSAMGAEVVIGNINDFRDVQNAMRGVSRAFHIPPFAPYLLHNTMLVCLAAQSEKIEALVLLSGWNPSPVHPSLLTREHWIANNIARLMPDVGVIHLNPGIFAFTYLLTLPITRKLGLLPLPYGESVNAPVAERDISRCAAALLETPEKYIGTSWRPTGPNLISGRDVATILSDVLARKVRYQPVSFKSFSKAARAMGFADFDSYNLRHYAEEIVHGAYAVGAPTDHVERLTGQPAEPFHETAHRYAANVSRLAPNVRDMSMLGALRFVVKMMLTPAPTFRALEAAETSVRLDNQMAAHQNADWQKAAIQEQLMLL